MYMKLNGSLSVLLQEMPLVCSSSCLQWLHLRGSWLKDLLNNSP
ncbi:hypothetical protein OROMI_032013 [Orobanche minor]